jgi:hypothetical protein
LIKYPILTKISRDVTVAFSTEERILNSFRSLLSPYTVETLICTQNWIKNKPIEIWDLEEFVIKKLW